MSAGVVRVLVVIVCVVGIAGMIVGSIADNNGVAMTFGVVTAVAILCQVTATSVLRRPPGGATNTIDAESAAAQVEEHIQGLVASGADEDALRRLARAAIVLGRVAP